MENRSKKAIEEIEMILLEKGITKYRLSKMTGISEGTLSRNFNHINEMSLGNYLAIMEKIKTAPNKESG